MVSRVEALASFFRSQPDRWIDGRELATIAGVYGWRSRVSDCRRPPHSLNVLNRIRRVNLDGRTFAVSEYRYQPPPMTTGGESPASRSSAWTLQP